MRLACGHGWVTVPGLRMPIPVHAPNPFREHAAREVADWLDRHGLCRSPGSRKRLERARITLPAALAFPRAPKDVIVLNALWTAWVFIVDDEFEEGPVGRRPERVGDVVGALLAALDGDGAGSPVERALAELWQRTRTGRSDAWCRYMRATVGRWMLTYHQDSADRAAGHRPTMEEYLARRPAAVAAYVYLALGEPAAGLDLAPESRALPSLRRLRIACAEYCALSNDLWSVAKDDRSGDENAMTLMRYHDGTRPQDAMNKVGAVLDRCAGRIVALREELRSAGAGASVLACAAAYEDVVRGCFDYWPLAARYADPSREAEGTEPSERSDSVHRLFDGLFLNADQRDSLRLASPAKTLVDGRD
ncbi:terpene synthase family protein [Streptomyces caatingaensis]|uniref:Uncharacterized protein n=1 Tax=Streptomyces caatingaensis TaxID=1678637 RepID=A0A0K9XDW1_9ACTN|nr:terpene synthase family protein [Streptomyces caatingaensis]KNB50837.1 hypothetical protein AC230_20640 [Streptomyces caatingaensis]